MIVLDIIAVLLGAGTLVMLAYYLVTVIKVLRSIAAKLANARLLLLTVAVQSEPVEGLVGGVAGNVSALDSLIQSVAKTVTAALAGKK